jgi:hypothetical protein
MNEREKVMVAENEVATTRGKKGIWTKPYFALLNSLLPLGLFVARHYSLSHSHTQPLRPRSITLRHLLLSTNRALQ